MNDFVRAKLTQRHTVVPSTRGPVGGETERQYDATSNLAA
jgi:hypothetical protein